MVGTFVKGKSVMTMLQALVASKKIIMNVLAEASKSLRIKFELVVAANTCTISLISQNTFSNRRSTGQISTWHFPSSPFSWRFKPHTFLQPCHGVASLDMTMRLVTPTAYFRALIPLSLLAFSAPNKLNCVLMPSTLWVELMFLTRVI